MVELITGIGFFKDIGKPLFQSHNEMDHVSLIIETLGKPPNEMIKESSKR